jgi:hypothetical protein
MPLIRKAPDAATAPAEGDLASRLASPSADIRWAAVRDAALEPETVAVLSQSLPGEPDARVREAIFTALAKIASPESAVTLLQALRSDEANLRTGAMDALRAAPALIEKNLPALLADADSDVRLLACDLARELDGATAQKLLCALIDKDSQPNVCAAAIEVLTEIGDKDALPSLARCANRFPGDPFLLFAIEAASERLNAARG